MNATTQATEPFGANCTAFNATSVEAAMPLMLPSWIHVIEAIAFTIGTLCATLASGLILTVFGRSPELRRQAGLSHLFILAMFDLCIGVGAVAEVLAQVRAFYQMPITKAQCLGEYSVIIFGVTASPLFVLLIAWDRLIGILKPAEYHAQQHSRLARRRGVAVMTVALLTTVVGFIDIEGTDTVVYCSPFICWNAYFRMYWITLASIGQIGLALLYFLLVYYSKLEGVLNPATKALSRADDNCSRRIAHDNRRRRRMTRIVLITVAVYVLLWSVPNAITFICRMMKVRPSVQMVLGCLIGLFQTLNASVNILIYARKSHTFKVHMRKMLHMKMDIESRLRTTKTIGAETSTPHKDISANFTNTDRPSHSHFGSTHEQHESDRRELIQIQPGSLNPNENRSKSMVIMHDYNETIVLESSDTLL